MILFFEDIFVDSKALIILGFCGMMGENIDNNSRSWPLIRLRWGIISYNIEM
jgi:hypothetical protein